MKPMEWNCELDEGREVEETVDEETAQTSWGNLGRCYCVVSGRETMLPPSIMPGRRHPCNSGPLVGTLCKMTLEGSGPCQSGASHIIAR